MPMAFWSSGVTVTNIAACLLPRCLTRAAGPVEPKGGNVNRFVRVLCDLAFVTCTSHIVCDFHCSIVSIFDALFMVAKACLRSSPPSINSTDTVEGYDYRSDENGMYDSLRREWRAWEKLFLKETGIAIDYAKNVVIAEDEWDILASGEEFECPSLTRLDEDDVYRPQMNLDEGSGDSEEELFGTSTGVSVQMPSDLEGMNLTSNTQPSAPSGSASIGKRKRGEEAGWEGTAHDARVFRNAIETPAMNFPHPPEGKYYLVDAGYPTPVGYIGPYKQPSDFTFHTKITKDYSSKSWVLFNPHQQLRVCLG
ncbi:hypothetical protein K1719_018471 [Acacia pycnantha]|nr:hypothetical protein K1719_018471 [Acacia pycnantha]